MNFSTCLSSVGWQRERSRQSAKDGIQVEPLETKEPRLPSKVECQIEYDPLILVVLSIDMNCFERHLSITVFSTARL